MGKWRVTDIDDVTFIAEDGERTEYVRGEHCRACVFAKLVTEHGGDVDLRGLHRYGPCYQFLAVTIYASRVDVRGKSND